MNIVQELSQYNQDHLYFNEPIKNNIMTDGQFIRVIYSTPYCVMNGIYLLLEINSIIVEKYYNKFKCMFDVINHEYLINCVRVIEESILNKIKIQHKNPQYKIYEQLKNGVFKLCIDNQETIQSHFLLKISGIWETNNEYGVTYKFMPLNNLVV